MTGIGADVLAGLIGLVGVATGASLVLDPKRAAATLGVAIQDGVAAMYARLCGIRNLAMGGLFLGAGYTHAIAHAAGAAMLLVALGLGWALVQGYDATIFARLGSRAGMLGAGGLALAALLAAALAWPR
jgi:hypothetical protein